MSSARGQVFAIDFLVAVTVFVLCLAFINSFWQNAVVSSDKAVERNRLALSAMVATDALLSSPGAPYGWESGAGNVTELGIAKKGSPNEIDAAKLAKFINMSSENVSRLLGMKSNCSIDIESMGSNESYHFGNGTYSGGSAAEITRYAVLDKKIVRVKVFAYN